MTRLRVATVFAVVSFAPLAFAQRPDSTPPRTVHLSAPVEVEMLNVGTEAAPLPAVEVMLNGHGPYRFGIETGARFLVVSSDVATSAGLTRLADSGGGLAYHADSITIGTATLGDVKLMTLARAPRGVDGLLGLPAFAELTLTLDYPRHRVRLERDTLPSADGKSILTTTRAADFVAIPIRYGSREIATIVDTRSATAFGIEPTTAEHFSWKTAPVVAGSAGGAGIPTTSISRGVFGDTIGLGQFHFLSAPIIIHALPADYPHEPRIGAGALKYFAFSLDQRSSRTRFVRDSSTSIDFAAPPPPTSWLDEQVAPADRALSRTSKNP